MAVYDYSPDGQKIADRRDECPVTMQLELWLETRSFRLPSNLIYQRFREEEEVRQFILNGFYLNESAFLFPQEISNGN